MNYSKRTKKNYEPANMSKKETIQTEYNEPLKLCPLISKVHYSLIIFIKFLFVCIIYYLIIP